MSEQGLDKKGKGVGKRIIAGSLGALIGVGSISAYDQIRPTSTQAPSVPASIPVVSKEFPRPTESPKPIDTNINFSSFIALSYENQQAKLKELLGKEVTLIMDYPESSEVRVDQWPYRYFFETGHDLGMIEYEVIATKDNRKAYLEKGGVGFFISNEQYKDFKTNWWGLEPKEASKFFGNKYVVLPRGSKIQMMVDDSTLIDGFGNSHREPRLVFKSIALPNQ